MQNRIFLLNENDVCIFNVLILNLWECIKTGEEHGEIKGKGDRNKRENSWGGGKSEDEANRHAGSPAAASVTKHT